MSSASPIDDAPLARRVTWLCRLLGVGGLALLGVTWKLWTPQDVFPRVPLFAWAPPRWWDWASLAALTAGLTGLCLPVRWRRVSSTAVAGGFAIQFLADQHRLQPWAWQFFILAVVIALADDRLVVRGWMMLVISIYFWSAWSKCDSAFLEQFTRVIFGVLSRPSAALGIKWLPPMNRGVGELSRILASVAPAVEFGIVLMLMSVRTHGLGVLLATAMHLYLITLLGPWGLGHQPGVLVWNAFFIVQNATLYRRSTVTFRDSIPFLKSASAAISRAIPHRIARLLLIVVMLWPVVEPWGYCDAWLGWAVYVPRFDSVSVLIEKSSLPADDSSFRGYNHNTALRSKQDLRRQFSIDGTIRAPRGFSSEEGEWVRANPAKLSLDVLNVPIYPNHRFLVGVAVDWQERYRLRNLELIHYRRPGRQHVNFEYVQNYTTPAQLEAYARTFRVNALPESVLRRRAEERAR